MNSAYVSNTIQTSLVSYQSLETLITLAYSDTSLQLRESPETERTMEGRDRGYRGARPTLQQRVFVGAGYFFFSFFLF